MELEVVRGEGLRRTTQAGSGYPELHQETSASRRNLADRGGTHAQEDEGQDNSVSAIESRTR